MLQVNFTVLATAHAISEGIVRGVNTEMQRSATSPTPTPRPASRAAPGPRHNTPTRGLPIAVIAFSSNR